MEPMRINRYLSACDCGSRRSCEHFISEGRVTLNGEIITDLATKVGQNDEVTLDGEAVQPRREITIVLNKPKKYLCTKKDPEHRPTIYHLLPQEYHHLNHVGRLDADSEGLIVLTNDGELAHSLTHPRAKIEKEYIVQIDRTFDINDRKDFLEGIRIEEGLAKVTELVVDQPRILRITLQQGLKRQIRAMLEAKKYAVKRLIRLRIGSLDTPNLKPGKWKKLGSEEQLLLQRNPPKTGRPHSQAAKRKPSPDPRRGNKAAKRTSNRQSKTDTRRGHARSATGKLARKHPNQPRRKA